MYGILKTTSLIMRRFTNQSYLKCWTLQSQTFPSRFNHFNCRHYSTEVSEHDKKTSINKKDFVMIYRYPYIVHAKVFNRVKVLQTSIAICIMPPFWGAYLFTDYITLSNTVTMTVVSCFAVSMMLLMGFLSQRLIGALYLDKSRDMLRVAHLTFWGGRRDFTVAVSDVVPLSDVIINPKNMFTKLKIYNKEQIYYFDSRFGVIVDLEMFEHVFGSTDVLRMK